MPPLLGLCLCFRLVISLSACDFALGSRLVPSSVRPVIPSTFSLDPVFVRHLRSSGFWPRFNICFVSSFISLGYFVLFSRRLLHSSTYCCYHLGTSIFNFYLFYKYLLLQSSVMFCGVAEVQYFRVQLAHCWRLRVLLEPFPYIALYLTGSLVVDGVLAQSLAYYFHEFYPALSFFRIAVAVAAGRIT